MSMIEQKEIVYDDGVTKQAFADSCDINKILKKAQKAGSLSFVNKYDEATFGEFEGYDLLQAHAKVTRANEIFADLPSEVRGEFKNDALAFAGFASNPENIRRLAELIPKIAEPGMFFPNPVRRPNLVETADLPEVRPVGDPPGQEPVAGESGGVS